MRWAQTISSIVNTYRQVTAKLTSGNPINVRQVTPFGIDSAPIPGLSGIYVETSLKGKGAMLGYVGPSNEAEQGGIRVYSTDSNGVVKASVYFKPDGVIEISGTQINIMGDIGNAVRYGPLDDGLQAFKTAMQAELSLIATGISGGGGSYTPGTLSIDISGAKINEIKTP